MQRITALTLISAIAVSLSPAAALAQQSRAFTDVKPGDFGFEAVEYLKDKNILVGYEDGTFRPNVPVNRAEAVKIIAAPLMTDTERMKIGKTVYEDIPANAWYIPYVEWSRQQLRFLDGPPKTLKFYPTRGVTKAEFLKMMIVSRDIDPNSYSEVKLSLSPDTNPQEWYYPYLRYSVSASVALPNTNGGFGLERPLSRIDVAVLLYRLLQYKEGKRTQFLLDQAQQNLIITLNGLEKSDVKAAEQASARALLSSRGAHASAPEQQLVRAVVKLTEGFRSLVRGYQAGIDSKYDEVIRLSGDAWFLGGEAKKISGDISSVATQLQGYAKTLANSARTRSK
ncbi:MAG: Ig-like proteinputative S-layer protein [Candidatus Peribacteria bacterium]|nr:Ig-like proteinputative S-layer protein [Candidatus Peribacteria bacterium]